MFRRTVLSIHWPTFRRDKCLHLPLKCTPKSTVALAVVSCPGSTTAAQRRRCKTRIRAEMLPLDGNESSIISCLDTSDMWASLQIP